MISRTYVNGVIAAKEKYFLGEKLLRLCESDAATALRTLKENGFGGDAAEEKGAEELIRAEEASINAFVREYAAGEAEREYFLAPLDTHNVKAYFKAHVLGVDVAPMLAEEGTLKTGAIAECFAKEDFSALPDYLQAETICENGTEGKGAKVGEAFEKALYAHLSESCKGESALKKILAAKADRTNLVIALRSKDLASAKEAFLAGGNVKADSFAFCFIEDEEKARAAAEKAGAHDLWKTYAACKESGGVAAAEKAAAEAEIDYFAKRKYELAGTKPFIYYVLRRRTECFNVRVALVCLNAGMKESEIKKRFRGV